VGIVLYIFIAFLALTVLVFFHELGHFLVARYFGVKVERFSIGFGTPIFKKVINGTEWVFAPILVGGYVKMKGQDDLNPLAKSSDPDSYNSKKPWQKILILLAGPLANLILAFFIYLFIALNGAPITTASGYIAPIVGEVAKDSPAFKAGLKEGDKIIKVGNYNIKYWYQITKSIQKSKDPITLVIIRDGKREVLTLNTKVVDDKNVFGESIKRRIIGIRPKIPDINSKIDFTLLDALKYAYNETINAAMLIGKGVGKVATGEVDSKNIGGAITIFDLIQKFAQKGFLYLLFIMALISVNLGVLNLLPIPALDGGHIMFNLYELVTRRELNERVYMTLTAMGWAFLLFLMFFGLYNDVNRLWLH